MEVLGVEESQVFRAREQHLRKEKREGGGGREEEGGSDFIGHVISHGPTCSKRDLALVLCSVSCNVTLARIV